jgi:hypothetical protein
MPGRLFAAGGKSVGALPNSKNGRRERLPRKKTQATLFRVMNRSISLSHLWDDIIQTRIGRAATRARKKDRDGGEKDQPEQFVVAHDGMTGGSPAV